MVKMVVFVSNVARYAGERNLTAFEREFKIDDV